MYFNFLLLFVLAEISPRPLRVLDADDESVSVGLDPLLVDRHPSEKPGGLQQVDNQDPYATEHTERLQSGKYLKS